MDQFNFDIKEEGDFSQGVPTLKEVALMHIRKISAICCEEFTKGYWEEKPVKVGGGIAMMRTYRPDQRAIFCNAVDFLLWLVTPLADQEFKDIYEDKEDKDLGDGEDKDKYWKERIKERKEIFKDINIMFARCNFFDSQTGQTES